MAPDRLIVLQTGNGRFELPWLRYARVHRADIRFVVPLYEYLKNRLDIVYTNEIVTLRAQHYSVLRGMPPFRIDGHMCGLKHLCSHSLIPALSAVTIPLQ